MSMKKRFCILIAIFVLCAAFQPCVLADGAAAVSRPAGTAAADSPVQGSHVFRPKVCSVYMEEVFGETMCETWYHLVDAVMAGEDTFADRDHRLRV